MNEGEFRQIKYALVYVDTMFVLLKVSSVVLRRRVVRILDQLELSSNFFIPIHQLLKHANELRAR